MRNFQNLENLEISVVFLTSEKLHYSSYYVPLLIARVCQCEVTDISE